MRVMVPRLSRCESVVYAMELFANKQFVLAFSLLLQTMSVIRRCLRTMIFITSRLPIAGDLVLNFLWNWLLFCKFNKARVLPEKLFVSLHRVHTCVLFIQKLLDWVGLLGTLKTEETQMRSVDNGCALCVWVKVGECL